jgi:hypothetical protein
MCGSQGEGVPSGPASGTSFVGIEQAHPTVFLNAALVFFVLIPDPRENGLRIYHFLSSQ